MSHGEFQPWFLKAFIGPLLKMLAACLIALLAFVSVKAAIIFGPTHAIAIFGITATAVMALTLADGIKNRKTSKFQWAALGVNFLLLVYSAMLLPTKEAIEILNKSGVTQNLLGELLVWLNI
ncbi:MULTISPECIES: hypothetical protein [unclassified Pseudomonas]|uniref:hypothetical protein n=1 Tax=unclassified Pseudomonas TaxID=196821 RepID=UPI0039B76381